MVVRNVRLWSVWQELLQHCPTEGIMLCSWVTFRQCRPIRIAWPCIALRDQFHTKRQHAAKGIHFMWKVFFLAIRTAVRRPEQDFLGYRNWDIARTASGIFSHIPPLAWVEWSVKSICDANHEDIYSTSEVIAYFSACTLAERYSVCTSVLPISRVWNKNTDFRSDLHWWNGFGCFDSKHSAELLNHWKAKIGAIDQAGHCRAVRSFAIIW
jgi:hypothetical protein